MLQFSFTENNKNISEPCPTTWTRTHGLRGARTSRVRSFVSHWKYPRMRRVNFLTKQSIIMYLN